MSVCLESYLDVGRKVVWIPERLPECQSEGPYEWSFGDLSESYLEI